MSSPTSVLAPQTRELLVLTIDPVASVAHLDARARQLAAGLPVRKYVALAKDYHDEPTDSTYPTVNHKILLLSNTPSSSSVHLEDPVDLPWGNCYLEPTPIDVRVRIAERDYTPVRRVSPRELARVNRACLEHARIASEAVVARSASSRSDSYYSLEFERRSVSTVVTSQGAVENESMIDNQKVGLSRLDPDPRDSFLLMTDEDEEEDWLSLSDHADYTESEPSLIGRTSSRSASASSASSSLAPRDLYSAPIDSSLKPFCTLEYEAHLRRTRAPVVDVCYDLSSVDELTDPTYFHAECTALSRIICDAERRLGRTTASFSFSSASSRETLEEQAHAMLHPENSDWEGWPLVARDTDSVMHSELESSAARGRESFLIMHEGKERRYRRRKLVMGLQRLQTEIGWRCSSAFRMAMEGPSRREKRILREDLCGPFD